MILDSFEYCTRSVKTERGKLQCTRIGKALRLITEEEGTERKTKQNTIDCNLYLNLSLRRKETPTLRNSDRQNFCKTLRCDSIDILTPTPKYLGERSLIRV